MVDLTTIAEISKDLHISRARVYQIIDSLDDKKKPLKDSDNRYILSQDVVNAIHQYYINNTNKDKQDKNTSSNDQLVNILRRQLEEKDQQINKFQKLLDQQQQLNLSSQKLLENQKSEQNIKNDTTQSRENDSKDDKSKPDTNISKQSEKPSNETRESFWKRLFR
ncbi:RepB family protein [Lentilactobacillus buchneri]|uniref:RepB family protein n=1 Tax=Lentilactobacillus buchneri TaxID=1581 RepID=UPI0021A6C2DD|nr:RepB family protein [Lentilactobacillus buchneri]MCT2899153.1 RepB family protein [Lentilactobacillus buchneri]